MTEFEATYQRLVRDTTRQTDGFDLRSNQTIGDPYVHETQSRISRASYLLASRSLLSGVVAAARRDLRVNSKYPSSDSAVEALDSIPEPNRTFMVGESCRVKAMAEQVTTRNFRFARKSRDLVSKQS